MSMLDYGSRLFLQIPCISLGWFQFLLYPLKLYNGAGVGFLTSFLSFFFFFIPQTRSDITNSGSWGKNSVQVPVREVMEVTESKGLGSPLSPPQSQT